MLKRKYRSTIFKSIFPCRKPAVYKIEFPSGILQGSNERKFVLSNLWTLSYLFRGNFIPRTDPGWYSNRDNRSELKFSGDSLQINSLSIFHSESIQQALQFTRSDKKK